MSTMETDELLARGEALILGTAAPFCERTAAALCDTIRGGLSIRAACKQCAINRATLYAWLGEHPDLQDRLTRAREDSIANMTEIFLHELDTIVELGKSGATKSVLRAHSIRADHLRRYIATVSKKIHTHTP